MSGFDCNASRLGTADAQKRRVRKEIRSLSEFELAEYKRALKVMLTVPTELGQSLFGPKYKSYLYYMVKHAAAAYDPRKDQVRVQAIS